MLLSLVLLLAMQSVRMPTLNPSPNVPDNGVSMQPGAVRRHYEDGVPVLGNIVFPSDVRPSIIEVELEAEDGTVVGGTKAALNGEFRFERVKLGSYYFIIVAEGFSAVRQMLIIDERNFTSARAAIQLRHLPGRIANLEDVVSVANLSRVPPKAAQKLFDRAMSEQLKNDLANAALNLEKAIRIAPDFYEATLQLGLQYQIQDRRDDAIRLLMRSIELNPSSMKARGALGQIYFEIDKFDDAADQLSQAVRLGSTSSLVYFAMGSSYFRLGELDRAEASLQRAFVISQGTLGKVYLQLHNLYIKRRQLDKALGQLDAYLAKFPNATDRETIRGTADKLRKGLNPR